MSHSYKASYLRISGLLMLFAVFSFQLIAQNWDVPADKKAKNSNIKFDELTSKEGEAVYAKKCVSCHGNPSKANMRRSFKPMPPDLASAGTQSLTDGELFYILNTGRGLMPAFAGAISESEQWKVISYLRSFNKSYKQVLAKSNSSRSKK